VAGHGPPPKDPEKRSPKSRAVQMTTLGPPPDPGDVPELVGDFNPPTFDWYATWAGSPQASMFVGTDWQRLAMLAPLVHDYFESPAKDLLGEIRLNEALLGATPVDRLRLRWRLPEEAPAEDAPKRRRRATDPRLKVVS
jgi:hypothetical protein